MLPEDVFVYYCCLYHITVYEIICDGKNLLPLQLQYANKGWTKKSWSENRDKCLSIPKSWGSREAALLINDETVVCSKHWPIGFDKYLCNGKWWPVHPPSIFIFDGIPAASEYYTLYHMHNFPHYTTAEYNTCTDILPRAKHITYPDEMNDFTQQQNLTYDSLKEVLFNRTRTFAAQVMAFENDNILFVLYSRFNFGMVFPRFWSKSKTI